MPLGYNPFQSGALRFPKKYQSDIQKYCQRDSGSDVLNSPFKRIVDLWYLCVCIGVYFDEKKDVKNHYRFMEGSVLKDDHYMIENLEIIALEDSGNQSILSEPNKMLEILNSYAFGGFDRVYTALSGSSDNLWNLNDYLIEKIK